MYWIIDVCMYAWMSVCIYVFHTYMRCFHTHSHSRIYMHAYICMFAWNQENCCVWRGRQSMQICMYVNLHIDLFWRVCVCWCVYVFLCMFLCRYSFLYVVCIYAIMYMCLCVRRSAITVRDNDQNVLGCCDLCVDEILCCPVCKPWLLFFLIWDNFSGSLIGPSENLWCRPDTVSHEFMYEIVCIWVYEQCMYVCMFDMCVHACACMHACMHGMNHTYCLLMYVCVCMFDCVLVTMYVC